MEFINRLNNIYVIDTNMWGFNHYMSAYLVEGKELVMVDTGHPIKFEVVKARIKAHGFSLSDISCIFVTHEHRDHGGNVAPLLRECPQATVYLHPLARDYFLAPEKIDRSQHNSAALLARPGGTQVLEPIPVERIKWLKDGDTFDLGDNEKLKIMFTPGHQPGGIVIFEEKNNGLFINDLVGNCFWDVNVQYPLNPLNSDQLKVIESLKKLVDLPLSYLYLGHYGIYDNPKPIMVKAIDNSQKMLNIGKKHIKAGTLELIADEVFQTLLPELENLKVGRGEDEYHYAAVEHLPFQSKLFAKYCQDHLDMR